MSAPFCENISVILGRVSNLDLEWHTDSLKCRSRPVLASLYFEHFFPVNLRRTPHLAQALLTFRLTFFKPNLIFTSYSFLSFL